MSDSNESILQVAATTNQVFDDKLEASLELLECTINYWVPKDGIHKPYFTLVNPQRKEHPLRLYRTSMVKIVDQLPKAFEKASELEANYPGEEMLHEVAVVNKHKNSYVRLIVTTFAQSAYVYVRLYEKKDDKMEPSRYGVRFMRGDNFKAFNDFVASCK